jgi:phosphoadenosine phosphosulfate reductase
MNLENKIKKSIKMLQDAQGMALQFSEDGFYLAFSGGKDSQCLYHIAQMAGVKFKSHMSITTLDPPELMKFIRKNYPDTVFHLPELNFYKLIVKKKSLPTRVIRYCCTYLKEQGGAGTVTLTGIRAAESSKRAKRKELEVTSRKYSENFDQFSIDKEKLIACVSGKDKIIINPIFDWTDHDVWEFLKSNKIEYCKLYDEGYKRIGCMFCPMGATKQKKMDLKRYPKVAAMIKKSIAELIKNGYGDKYSLNADELFDWWISNDNQKSYIEKKKQLNLF